uniref:Interleukin n=1 Tax=Pavo cristatus TaxID=9049 RepID=A0A8C9EK07_PAVCR
MLGMAQPTQNSAGAWRRLESQKTHVKSICLQYQLYLLLNSHFFSLSGKLYPTFTYAILILKLLQLPFIFFFQKECQEPVMRCFFLEMKVILHECNIKKCSRTQDVFNIWKNGYARFETNQLNSTTSKKCKECEEYEEKNFTEFIQSFVKVIQKECK